VGDPKLHVAVRRRREREPVFGICGLTGINHNWVAAFVDSSGCPDIPVQLHVDCTGMDNAPQAGVDHPVTLGSTFASSDPSAIKYCALRYDFKPASVNQSQPGTLHVQPDNKVLPVSPLPTQRCVDGS
jgi:hypothetical protein